jgi:hypothetical protein
MLNPKMESVRYRVRRAGIPLGDGRYTGCAYGYGDFTPLTGPLDCPICEGSGIEGVVGTTMPHPSFGDPECCGCLNGVVSGDQADIVCNECEAAVRSVPTSSLRQALTEMELTLDVDAAMCPHCGGVNLFPGFSKVMAYTCRKCGESVELPNR